jgi:hypothetical protein
MGIGQVGETARRVQNTKSEVDCAMPEEEVKVGCRGCGKEVMPHV